MTNTDNYNLNLIEDTDLVDFAPFNANATIIDTKLKEVADAAASIPTLQTAVSTNSSDITALQNRAGEDESAISANASAITSIQGVNTAQWSAINTNSTDIEALEGRAAALELEEGDIIKFSEGAWVENPTIKKRIKFIGESGLDYEGKLTAVLPAEYLPANFTKFYVNAAVYSASSNDNLATTLYFNRAYISQYGGLNIEFKSIKSGLVQEGTVTAEDTNSPSVNNLSFAADIIFI